MQLRDLAGWRVPTEHRDPEQGEIKHGSGKPQTSGMSPGIDSKKMVIVAAQKAGEASLEVVNAGHSSWSVGKI